MIQQSYYVTDAFLQPLRECKLTLKALLGKYPDDVRESHYLAALEGNVDQFTDIPDEHRTYAVCKSALQKKVTLIAHVPIGMLLEHEDLIESALTVNGPTLGKIPEALRLKKWCITALLAPGGDAAAQYIPDGEWDERMAWVAVGLHDVGIQVIPERFRSTALCLYSLNNHVPWGFLTSIVPPSNITEDLCVAAASKGYPLDEIPERHRTDKVCAAYLQYVGTIRPYDRSRLRLHWYLHIPSTSKHEDMAVLWVSNGLRYADLPSELQKSSKVIDAFLKRDGRNLRYVERITPRRCRIAVEQNSEAWRYVPQDLRHELPEHLQQACSA